MPQVGLRLRFHQARVRRDQRGLAQWLVLAATVLRVRLRSALSGLCRVLAAPALRLAAGARSVQRKGLSRNACAGGCLQWLSIASLCCFDALSSVVLSERAVRRLQTGRQSCAKLILFRPQPRSLAEAVALAGEGAWLLRCRGSRHLLRRGRLEPCQVVGGIHYAVVGLA